MSNCNIHTILIDWYLIPCMNKCCGIWFQLNEKATKTKGSVCMILTMATKKAFQHSGSLAKLWRMTSSRVRQPITDISDGRICWLDLLIFLWKMKQTDVHIWSAKHTHTNKHIFICTKLIEFTFLTSVAVNGSMTASVPFLNLMQNLQENMTRL